VHLHSAGVIDGALRLLSSVKMDDLPALVRFLTQVLAAQIRTVVLGSYWTQLLPQSESMLSQTP
jgi:hypothetical protein